MKALNIIFILLSILYYETANAQPTFNKRLNCNYPSMNFLTVEVKDTFIYVLSYSSDTVKPYKDVPTLTKVNLTGDILNCQQILNDSIYEYVLVKTIQSKDGNFLSAGYANKIIPPYHSKGLLCKYNKDGKVIFKTFINGQVDPDYFGSPTGLTELSDGNIVVHGRIQLSQNNYKPYIVYFDHLGIIKWNLLFGDFDFTYGCSSILETESKQSFLVCNRGHRQGLEPFVEDLIYFDSLGKEYFHKIIKMDKGEAFGVNILQVDSNLITGLNIRLKDKYGNIIDDYQPGIGSYSSNGTKNWLTKFNTFDNDSTSNTIKFFTSISTTSDRGYIACGVLTDPAIKDKFAQYGMLAKVNEHGDSMWIRYYQSIPGHKYGNLNSLEDVKSTPDKGYILAGVCYYYCLTPEMPKEERFQQGWLIKVDSFGCLVPGCHLGTSVETIQPDQFKCTIYPNPTSNTVNIFCKHHPNRKGIFTLQEIASGKVLEQWTHNIDEITYILDVEHLSLGVYVISYFENGKIIWSDKLVKN